MGQSKCIFIKSYRFHVLVVRYRYNISFLYIRTVAENKKNFDVAVYNSIHIIHLRLQTFFFCTVDDSLQILNRDTHNHIFFLFRWSSGWMRIEWHEKI